MSPLYPAASKAVVSLPWATRYSSVASSRFQMALPSSFIPLNAAWMPEEIRFPIATVATESPEPN